jgi:hypothetical protein
MGLDQYAYAVMPHPNNTDLSYVWTHEQSEDKVFMIAQWRKHPNIQGWMEKLYESKGGEGVFNCQPVRVTFQDLVNLRHAVINEKLPVTQGFFFGESLPEDREIDLKFIDDAMKAIGQDMEIYYDSWW